MTTKRRPLDTDAIKQATGSKSAQSATEARTATKPDSAGDDTGQKHVQPSRVNQVVVSGYFPPEVRKLVKTIALEQDKTMQQLLGEALNHMFADYGKATIAPTEKAGE